MRFSPTSVQFKSENCSVSTCTVTDLLGFSRMKKWPSESVKRLAFHR